MCLAVPGRVVEWIEREPLFAAARVEFDGIRRVVAMSCVPDAAVGDYVLVHAGIAIARIDAERAAQTVRELRQLAGAELTREWAAVSDPQQLPSSGALHSGGDAEGTPLRSSTAEPLAGGHDAQARRDGPKHGRKREEGE